LRLSNLSLILRAIGRSGPATGRCARSKCQLDTVSRIESPKHFGHIDEGVARIGFDAPRFELALGAFAQLASVFFDDQYGHGGAIRERRELLVGDRPVVNRSGEHACHISAHFSRPAHLGDRGSRGATWPGWLVVTGVGGTTASGRVHRVALRPACPAGDRICTAPGSVRFALLAERLVESTKAK